MDDNVSSSYRAHIIDFGKSVKKSQRLGDAIKMS